MTYGTKYEEIPLHVLGKEGCRVYLDDAGAIILEHVSRNQYGMTNYGESMRFHPDNAEELIKAIRRTVRKSDRQAKGKQ